MPSLSELLQAANKPYEWSTGNQEMALAKQKTLADIVSQTHENKYRDALTKLTLENSYKQQQLTPLEVRALQSELDQSDRINPLEVQGKQLQNQQLSQSINQGAQLFPLDTQTRQLQNQQLSQSINQGAQLFPLDTQTRQLQNQQLSQNINQGAKLFPLDVQSKSLDTQTKQLAIGQFKGEQQQAQLKPVYDAVSLASIMALKAPKEQQPSLFAKAVEALGTNLVDPIAKAALGKFTSLASDPDALKAMSLLSDKDTFDKGVKYLDFAARGFTGGGTTDRTPMIKPVYNPTTGKTTYQDFGSGAPVDTGALVPPKVGEQTKLSNYQEEPSATQPGSGLVDVVAYDREGNKHVVSQAVPSEAYIKANQAGMAKANQDFSTKLSNESMALETEKFGLAQAKQIMDKMPTEQGKFSDYRLVAREIANMIPGVRALVDDETVGPSQLVNSIMSGLRIESLGGSSLAGVSNYEQQILKEKLPSLSQSPEGMALTMEYRNSFIKRKQDLNEFVQKKYGDAVMSNTPINLQSVTIDWLKKNPIQNYVTDSMEEKTDNLLINDGGLVGLPNPEENFSKKNPQGVKNKQANVKEKKYFSRSVGYELSEADLRETYKEAKEDGYRGTLENFKTEYGFEETDD